MGSAEAGAGLRASARLGVDIGGTFTDAALEVGGRHYSAKVLTTQAAPDDGVIAAVDAVIGAAGITVAALDLVIHGTTLATNALIERKGAKTAMLTTAGMRDVVEIGLEYRFDLFDLFIDLPAPLVPRHRRLAVRERIGADGRILLDIDEADVAAAIETLRRQQIEAVSVCFLHSYMNPEHEQRVGEMLARALPGVAVSLSSEVAPEMREYERFCTACANAYVQPRMASYLHRLERRLVDRGFAGPLLMMLSGGGLTTVETAARFPVRLIESGPAGGAVFAASVAAENGLPDVVSFDMGGTTAKICLIDDFRPQTSRTFEVARVYRFKKGSGLPIRIPVIDMVEIGAGGGSIASIDSLGRVAVGPESAGSEPGPVCYGRGGAQPTVTDADLGLSWINPAGFAGGRFPLDQAASQRAIAATIGAPLDLAAAPAAAAVVEMVEENMAAAARVHAIESGKVIRDRTLIAFGGAAPLHAAGVMRKLGMRRFLVPAAAGVGSAVGFLRAPVSYEIARSRQQSLSRIDIDEINAMLKSMSEAARAVVRPAAGDVVLQEVRNASMRYFGQGHEITVAVPARVLSPDDRNGLLEAFAARYREVYGRVVPRAEVEVLTWSVLISAATPPAAASVVTANPHAPPARAQRDLFETKTFRPVPHAVHWRPDLHPGAVIAGPAVIEEDETSTLIPQGMTARVLPSGAILCEDDAGAPEPAMNEENARA